MSQDTNMNIRIDKDVLTMVKACALTVNTPYSQWVRQALEDKMKNDHGIDMYERK